jgi:hypothetical protein
VNGTSVIGTGTFPAQGTGVQGGSGGGGGSDPFFANVKALLHFDGADGGTTFTDVKGHTFSITAGTPTTEVEQFKFGTASLRMPGTASVLTGASHADFTYPQQFTFEAWIRPDTVGSTRALITLANGGAAVAGFYLDGSSQVVAFFDGLGTQLVSTTTISATTWTHIAITRDSSNVCRLFIDGVVHGSTVSTATTLAGPLSIIFGAYAGVTLNGQLGYEDDFRLTLGTCRYTGTFSPPTAAFPDS